MTFPLPQVLDGALGTELDAVHPAASHHPLWLLLTLLEHPDRITAIHKRYVDAGALLVLTALYQASERGLLEHGGAHGIAGPADCVRVFEAAVAAVVAAGARYVGGSIGPYGAYLAGGEEYTGEYGLADPERELESFHRLRLDTLCAHPQVALLAVETVPLFAEVRVLVAMLRAQPKPFYVSCSMRDACHLADGTHVAEVVRWLASSVPANLVAVGSNCIPLASTSATLRAWREALDAAGVVLPLVVYPNSGEVYDGESKAWTGDSSGFEEEEVAEWRLLGAELVGGCCRVGPSTIAQVASWIE